MEDFQMLRRGQIEMLVVKFKGIVKAGKDIQKWADNTKKAMDKASVLALQRVGWIYMNKARDELKDGKLGLTPRKSYRNEPGDPMLKTNVPKYTNKPLWGINKGITYYVNKRWKTLSVGFRGVKGTAWQARIARKSVSGYRIRVTKPKRELLHTMGIHLRKTTKSVPVPGRDVMGAFYQKYYSDMLKDYKCLYLKKMSGGWIGDK